MRGCETIGRNVPAATVYTDLWAEEKYEQMGGLGNQQELWLRSWMRASRGHIMEDEKRGLRAEPLES